MLVDFSLERYYIKDKILIILNHMNKDGLLAKLVYLILLIPYH